MCGIVGYVGPKSTVEVLLGGLKRLEYRGYDSAGVSVINKQGLLETRKKAGKLTLGKPTLALGTLDGQPTELLPMVTLTLT
jgi:glucosamine--fructose-6-phosphate aminotransferase (isomerizing)